MKITSRSPLTPMLTSILNRAEEISVTHELSNIGGYVGVPHVLTAMLELLKLDSLGHLAVKYSASIEMDEIRKELSVESL